MRQQPTMKQPLIVSSSSAGTSVHRLEVADNEGDGDDDNYNENEES
jgi:hypothetical protein